MPACAIPRSCPISGLLFALVLLPATVRPALGQVPDPPWRNLQVLPQDISRDSLIETMRWYSFGLGARCEHCHVGETGAALSTFDFAADDRPLKRKAREMTRMVREINERLLAAMPDRQSDAPRVTCITCHRGQRRPLILEDTLARIITAGGVERAIVEYRTLRERHASSGHYDFRPQTLMNVADRLVLSDTAGAIDVLRLNAEVHPRHVATHRRLATLLLATGQREPALFAVTRVLELAPDDAPSRRMLEQLLAR